jgi:deoxyribodipyrimidine photolyase-related protein
MPNPYRLAVESIWVLGDQLNRDIGALAQAEPGDARILMVQSRSLLTSRPWHRQRAYLVLTAMRRFAKELEEAGFEVDFRTADTLAEGVREHVSATGAQRVLATEPNSWDARQLMDEMEVGLVRSDQFLCHYEDFIEWVDGRKAPKMEDFYRWQRRRLDYLMDGEDEPAGGRWNYDEENRERPPKDGRSWPEPLRDDLDGIDRSVLEDLPANCVGADPDGTWATSRAGALRRLEHVVSDVLPTFGPHEDAMLSSSWQMSHTLLSPYLNLGLLLPGEVCDAAEEAYRAGSVPIASAEGFIRQVIGWREYVWGRYWQLMPEYRELNELRAERPLPPLFARGTAGEPDTGMNCVSVTLEGVSERAYAHHIQRLMVLGNLALLAGVQPAEFNDWMWESFVDAAEWVMVPNVLGMALHADGGVMATKPYAAGGAYIDRMSDYCADCRFDRRKRTGEDACPFTTLYWDFIDRHSERFEGNARMVRQVRACERLEDMSEVRERAGHVLARLDEGVL